MSNLSYNNYENLYKLEKDELISILLEKYEKKEKEMKKEYEKEEKEEKNISKLINDITMALIVNNELKLKTDNFIITNQNYLDPKSTNNLLEKLKKLKEKQKSCVIQ